ncbi:MAG TPA: hypothetical protein DDW42_06570 [Desulfobacteraceae bacterium]|nr:hypothetical protein [Desulfobacteraceae bacterium]
MEGTNQKFFMEDEVVKIILEKGPLTGSEILEAVGGDGLELWRTCRISEKLLVRTIGTRYLRLDRRVEGFARLSPSILREFLTYSVVGIAGDAQSMEERANELVSHIEEVSKAKLDLAYRVVYYIATQLENEWSQDNKICFIIAGDIVYNMAHDVPRPERSTGKMVNGSDMDLVVILDDRFPERLMKRLDDAIYQEKYRLLINPHTKEEIDYVVKKLTRVQEQVRFKSFRQMVACKILQEGTLLYGNEDFFRIIKGMLRTHNVTTKLNALEKEAGIFRRDAEEYLLYEEPDKIKRESLYLFYPTDESEEFE